MANSKNDKPEKEKKNSKNDKDNSKSTSSDKPKEPSSSGKPPNSTSSAKGGPGDKHDIADKPKGHEGKPKDKVTHGGTATDRPSLPDPKSSEPSSSWWGAPPAGYGYFDGDFGMMPPGPCPWPWNPPPPGFGGYDYDYVDYDCPEEEEPADNGSRDWLFENNQTADEAPQGEGDEGHVQDTPVQDDQGEMEATDSTGVDLLQAHLAEFADDAGCPVPDRLASLVNEIWEAKGKSFSRDKIKALFEKHPRPANTHFHRVDINDEIKSAVNKSKMATGRDYKLRSIQGGIAKAAIPMTQMVNDLISKDIPGSTAVKQSLVNNALDGLTVLANANASINQLRRDMLRPFLDQRFANLCQEQVKSDSALLYGDPGTLAEKMRTVQQAGRLARQSRFPGRNSMSRPPYGARWHPYTWGRGRGSRPYSGYSGYGGYTQSQGAFLGMSQISTDFPTSSADFSPTSDKNQPEYTQNSPQFSRCRPGTRSPKEEGSRSEQINTPDNDKEISAKVGKCPEKLATYFRLNKWKTFIAGRVSTRLHRWAELTSDPSILSEIQGIKIPFVSTPYQKAVPHPIRFSGKEHEFIRQEIEAMLQKGVIEKTDHTDGEFISNIFLREKKQKGKFRMILNLRELNEKFVEYHHFKMDTLESVLHLIHKDSYLASLDFSDAYYSLAIDPAYRKYLRFKFEGQLYQFNVLPNGLACGPRIFTKIMKVPLSHLREKYGITISGYLDDTISCEDTTSLSEQAIMIGGDVMQDLGFMINVPKSAPVGAWELEHLGFLLSSHTMMVTLPEEKIQSLQSLVSRTLRRPHMTIREGAKVIGSLIATAHGNRFAQMFTKRLEVDKSRALAGNGYDFEEKMTFSGEAKADLHWWLENLPTVFRPIKIGIPDVEIRTDSSLSGWGAVLPATRQNCGTRWTAEEACYHINYLELKAILLGLQALLRDTQNAHIRILSDNTTAVGCVNNQGSTHSKSCNEITRKIWEWARGQDNWLSCVHIPGVENVEADHASRHFKDDIEWALADGVFQQLCQAWGTPTVDLFASRLNKKGEKFYSWRPDPESAGVDAFAFDWSQDFCYAFPPFCLVGKMLQKFETDMAEGIAIVPYWPSQPWFTQIPKWLVDFPYFIPVNHHELFLHSRDKVHPLAGQLKLLACRISCRPIVTGDTQMQWLEQCSRQEGNLHRNSMVLMKDNGDSSAPQRTLIPLRHISQMD